MITVFRTGDGAENCEDISGHALGIDIAAKVSACRQAGYSDKAIEEYLMLTLDPSEHAVEDISIEGDLIELSVFDPDDAVDEIWLGSPTLH